VLGGDFQQLGFSQLTVIKLLLTSGHKFAAHRQILDIGDIAGDGWKPLGFLSIQAG
jgi:hypothetical protein